MKIDKIFAEEVKDSRGEPTIAISIALSGQTKGASTAIPSGKSRGSREATVFSPDAAKASINQLLAAGILEQDLEGIGALDYWLLKCDPSIRKQKIGGNLAVGL
ncbi:MAG: hypothetical protein V1489_01455, partial [Candidatus Liptonbacteria bacterium]